MLKSPNLYVSTNFFWSANDFDWNFGQYGNLCVSEHSQHVTVLLFDLPDFKWLFLVNFWLVPCLNLLLSWPDTIFAIGLKYWYNINSSNNDLLGVYMNLCVIIKWMSQMSRKMLYCFGYCFGGFQGMMVSHRK